jgi:hypothetical protein
VDAENSGAEKSATATRGGCMSIDDDEDRQEQQKPQWVVAVR